MKIVSYKQGVRGTEFIVEDNGRDFRLRRIGFVVPANPSPEDVAEAKAWATAEIATILAAEATDENIKQIIISKLTPENVDAFVAWMKANRTRSNVKPLLLELATIYYHEVTS